MEAVTPNLEEYLALGWNKNGITGLTLSEAYATLGRIVNGTGSPRLMLAVHARARRWADDVAGKRNGLEWEDATGARLYLQVLVDSVHCNRCRGS